MSGHAACVGCSGRGRKCESTQSPSRLSGSVSGILDPIVVIIVFEVLVTLFFCLLRSVNRRSPPPLPLQPFPRLTIPSSSPFLCLCKYFLLRTRTTEMRVCDLLGSCLVGKCLYFQIETTCCIIYRLSILWGEKGDRKWDDHMGEWSVPRMEWSTVGRADRGLGPEWMWGWNAVVMGTVKWRWEARWYNFIDHDVYKHNTTIMSKIIIVVWNEAITYLQQPQEVKFIYLSSLMTNYYFQYSAVLYTFYHTVSF